MSSSEGEAVAMNFGSRVGGLGQPVRKAAVAGKPLVVLLDAIDSGASIERTRSKKAVRPGGPTGPVIRICCPATEIHGF